LLLGLCVGIVAWLPIPHYLVQLPGPPIPTRDQVWVDDYERPADPGEFFITTVYQRPATAWWWLRALIQPDWAIERQPPTPTSLHALSHGEEENHELLRQVVYHTCGIELLPAVHVLDLTPKSPLRGLAEPGDQLVSIQGVRVREIRQVRYLLQAHEQNASLEIELKSPEQPIRRYTIRPLQGDKGPSLGTFLSSRWDDSHLPRIFFKSGSYQGNSSNLSLALDLCERLLRVNLRQGRKIAATGGLAADGSITAVQGLRQKFFSAARANAQVFLIPAEGTESAPADPALKGMKVVRVRSLGEAISWLRQGHN